MTAIADYAYLNCRVSIRAEGLLPPTRLADLATGPDGQVADILRGAGFPQLAEQLPSSPRGVEQSLVADYLEDITVLMRPLKGAARAFMNHWKHRFEIINLKRCIRHQLAGLPPAELRNNLIEIGPMQELPIDDLLRAENAEEVLRRLEGTPYAEMARHAREVYEERHSLFDLEAVLDSRYYRGLIDRYKSLNGNDRDSLRRLMGTFTDQINLVWLLRYRFVFGLASPHAYLLLIPPGYSLKRSHLLSLVQMETMENVFQSLPPPLDADVGNATSIIEVEKAMTKRTHRIAERVLRHTGFNLARALAYLILRERQILKVHVLLKGRVMKLDEESIRIAARLPDDFLQQAVAG